MAGLPYLKNSFYLGDEELAARWSENVVWQFFSGMVNCPGIQGGRLTGFRRTFSASRECLSMADCRRTPPVD